MRRTLPWWLGIPLIVTLLYGAYGAAKYQRQTETALALERAKTSETRYENRALATSVWRHQTIITMANKYDVRPAIIEHILIEARRLNIPRSIGLSLVDVESDFRERARSYAGAIGLTQVKLSTAQILRPDITERQLYNPHVNITIGFEYLKRLYKRYDDWERALAAYNAGPTRHSRADRTGEYDGTPYARKVLAR